jgi:hypothetical protein
MLFGLLFFSCRDCQLLETNSMLVAKLKAANQQMEVTRQEKHALGVAYKNLKHKCRSLHTFKSQSSQALDEANVYNHGMAQHVQVRTASSQTNHHDDWCTFSDLSCCHD